MKELIPASLLWKFLKFSAVGFSGLFVDFGFTFLCKEVFNIQKYIANAIGFTLAASSNYILNRIWTFHSRDSQIFLEYSQFIIISLIGLGLNTLVLWFVIKKFKINFYISKAFAIAVVTIFNFLANAFITFA